MIKKLVFIAIAASLFGCKGQKTTETGSNKQLSALFNNYWEERMQLFPMEATAYGDNRYNDRLTITIGDGFRIA